MLDKDFTQRMHRIIYDVKFMNDSFERMKKHIAFEYYTVIKGIKA
jgi:hypothetical protein